MLSRSKTAPVRNLAGLCFGLVRGSTTLHPIKHISALLEGACGLHPTGKLDRIAATFRVLDLRHKGLCYSQLLGKARLCQPGRQTYAAQCYDKNAMLRRYTCFHHAARLVPHGR